MAGNEQQPDDTYLAGETAATFDFEKWLCQYDERLLADPRGRRALCRLDPMLFAVLYLRKHLMAEATGGKITFNDMHLELYRQARQWIKPRTRPRQFRDAYIAPRESGKSSMLFLILPLWAAAHRHVRFIAAFSDSATQAETHLATFKHELDTNELLRNDHPYLCTPATRPKGAQVADHKGMLQTKGGFVFAARGADSGNLGLKVGDARPDLILCDDIEPGEAKYSLYQAHQRLMTLQDVILPLSEHARVILVGTVTMPGSIIHQLVKHGRGDPEAPNWIADQNFRTHHFHAIVPTDDGGERSMWPAKWSIEYLNEIRHSRAYLKNFANDPRGNENALVSEYLLESRRMYNPSATAIKYAVCVDPSGGGRDSAGIIGGWLGDDGRLYWSHDATIVGPSEKWSKAACQLAYDIGAETIGVESNYGGDMSKLVLRNAWETVCRENGVNKLCPSIAPVVGKRGKWLRAEPVAQQLVDDRIRLSAPLPRLESEWTTWGPTSADSPGRIDASVYLAYLLLPIPGSAAVVSSAVGVSKGGGRAGGRIPLSRGMSARMSSGSGLR